MSKTPDAAPDDPVDPESANHQTVFDTLRAAGGEEEAYTRLFQRHYPRILRATALRLGLRVEACDDDVENGVQEAFFDVFQRLRHGEISGIHTPGAFRRYVARAARNRVIDQRRRRQAAVRGAGQVRRMSSLLGDASASLLGAVATSGEDAIERIAEADLEARLEAALLELEEPYKTAIEMSYLFEMSPTEIAETGELLGARDQQPIRKAAHVRLVLHRAREQLRARLGLGG